jgi:hypothetical protein
VAIKLLMLSCFGFFFLSPNCGYMGHVYCELTSLTCNSLNYSYGRALAQVQWPNRRKKKHKTLLKSRSMMSLYGDSV